MKIEIIRLQDLHPIVKSQLNDRVDREFSHVDIVRNHIWSQPDWVFLLKDDDEIVSFLNLVDRNGLGDNQPVHFFGLNNVITEPIHRNKGFSLRLNHAVIDHMKTLDHSACGLLFCADELVPFYQKFGWAKFHGKVLVNQPSGEKEWSSNCMLLPLGSSSPQPRGLIHLNGLPW